MTTRLKFISNQIGPEWWTTVWRRFWPEATRLLVFLTGFVVFWQWRHTYRFAYVGGEYFEYASLHIYAADVLCIMALLFAMVSRWKLGWKEIPKHLRWLLGGIAVWSLLSAAWSPVPMVALSKSAEYLLWLGFACLLISNHSRVKEIGAWIVAGATVSAGVGVLQWWQNHSLGLQRIGESVLDPAKSGIAVVVHFGERWLRASGLAPHPNIFAGTMLIAWGWLLQGWAKVNWRLVVGQGLLMVAVGLSFARSAWLAFVIVWVAVLVWAQFNARKGLARALLLAGLVFVVTLAANYDALLPRFSPSSSALETRSVQERVQGLELWREVVGDRWLFGVGNGSYTLALAERYPETPVWELQPVHNVALLVWAELGLLGLLMFGLFALMLTRHILIARVQPTRLIPAAAWLVVGLVDHWPWSLHAGYVGLFLALALIFWPQEI